MEELVRCVECETDPLAPKHFCECCGRKLPVAESVAPEVHAAPPEPVVETPAPSASRGACESCGGPSSDAPLCESCQSAFQFVIDASAAPNPPQSASEANESAPAPEIEGSTAPEAESKTSGAERVEVMATVPAPTEPVPTEPQAIESLVMESLVTEPERAAVVDETHIVSAQQSTAQRMGLAAAAVIAVAAMGVPLGVWLGMRHRPQPEPTPTAATPVQKAAVTPAPVSPAVAPAKNTEVLAPQPQPVAEAQPTAAVPRLPPASANKPAAAKTVRKAEPARRPVALQAAPVPVVQGLAALPASAIPASQPVAELPRTVTPTPPAGRLFEPGDVDDAPRVATRVAPQVPDDVLKHLGKDVVVVRVLVSQTGHPFRVSLLRRSLGGRSVDDAVVAAVSSWTFSPARKRGEAVSCWMNFGVPIGQ